MGEGDAARGPVLLVDDDEVFVDLVGRQLVAHGFTVVTAGSVDACRQLLDEGLRPGLLMLDINLPDESGWSLLRDARLAAAGAPPVVIVSGTEVRAPQLRQFGVAGFLPKPVSMALLTACTERLMRAPTSDELTESKEVLG